MRIKYHLCLCLCATCLSQIMNESRELEPLRIRVILPDPLGRLEGVHDVGHVDVGVGLVHQLVQHVQGLHDGPLVVVEVQPLGMLEGKGVTETRTIPVVVWNRFAPN